MKLMESIILNHVYTFNIADFLSDHLTYDKLHKNTSEYESIKSDILEHFFQIKKSSCKNSKADFTVDFYNESRKKRVGYIEMKSQTSKGHI